MTIGTGIAIAGSVFGITIPLTILMVRSSKNGNNKYVRKDMCELRTKTFNEKIDKMDEKIDGLSEKIDTQIDRVCTKIDNFKKGK